MPLPFWQGHFAALRINAQNIIMSLFTKCKPKASDLCSFRFSMEN